MEEKKVKRISLSTILLILSIIVIIIMACFIYKLNNDKQLANRKVSELNNQVSELESAVNNLQSKISDISNTITKDNVNTETDSNSTTKTFSNDEIKNTIQNYLDLRGKLEGSPEGLLLYLNLINEEENTEKVDDYIKTNIKYSEYKAKMLNYMTEQLFEKHFTTLFKNINGYLYYFDGGATGLKFEVKSITKKEKYSDSSYIAIVDDIDTDNSREQENIEFHIENYNGKCVISYCDI